MTLVAVDAGIAIKWYVPEIHHAEARRLLDGSFTLQAPDLIAAEFTNIVWKKHLLRNELTLAEAQSIVSGFETAPVDIYASMPLMAAALKLAIELRHAAYDCLYLAHAIAADCPLITADKSFYTAAERGGYGKHLTWIEDIT